MEAIWVVAKIILPVPAFAVLLWGAQHWFGTYITRTWAIRLFIGSVIWFAAWLCTDFTSPHSTIRASYAKSTRNYEVISFKPASIRDEPFDLIQPTADIRFLRDTRSPVQMCVYLFRMGRYEQKFCKDIRNEERYQKGHDLRIPLATMPVDDSIPGYQLYRSAWEVKRPNGEKYSLLKNGRYLVKLKIGSQTERFLIKHLANDNWTKGTSFIAYEGENIWGND